jgi:zinc/manganese transport system ATP-binding protein
LGSTSGDDEPVLSLHDAAFEVGNRTLWSGLDLDLAAGEFLAVIGANGTGKTSLLRVILGLAPLSAGTVTVAGTEPRRARRHVGYMRQQPRVDALTPLRAKDVVRQGIDGDRWGFGKPFAVPWDRIQAALDAVGAGAYANEPIAQLSGGEQQRVRVAQALIGDPTLLLCDEPLLSLDLRSQQDVTALIDDRRRERNTATVFVTHEINPVLPYVDRVLYLAGGRAVVGSVDDVMNSATLSELYGVAVEVIRRDEAIFVAGTPASHHHDHEDGHTHD